MNKHCFDSIHIVVMDLRSSDVIVKLRNWYYTLINNSLYHDSVLALEIRNVFIYMEIIPKSFTPEIRSNLPNFCLFVLEIPQKCLS